MESLNLSEKIPKIKNILMPDIKKKQNKLFSQFIILNAYVLDKTLWAFFEPI